MNIFEAIENRHSVRSYNDKKIEDEVVEKLELLIKEINKKTGLHLQLILDEPKAFDSLLARYGKFSNVKNYIALVGKKGKDIDELLGYYGERLVLEAEMLGLNSCWVGGTFSRRKSQVVLEKKEKLRGVIALGYGKVKGKAHKSKSIEKLCSVKNMPTWFKSGMKAASLAPTALNQQKFHFMLVEENVVYGDSIGGFYSYIDLGIVKYHFEIGAGRNNFTWK